MNAREVRSCFEGYQERLRSQAAFQDKLNHMLGRYIAIGVNAPKKYPKEPFLSENKQGAYKMTTDQEVMKYFTAMCRKEK